MLAQFWNTTVNGSRVRPFTIHRKSLSMPTGTPIMRDGATELGSSQLHIFFVLQGNFEAVPLPTLTQLPAFNSCRVDELILLQQKSRGPIMAWPIEQTTRSFCATEFTYVQSQEALPEADNRLLLRQTFIKVISGPAAEAPR